MAAEQRPVRQSAGRAVVCLHVHVPALARAPAARRGAGDVAPGPASATGAEQQLEV